MGFRDDSEAVRARAEALERENRDLRRKLEEMQGAPPEAEAPAPRRGSSTLWVAGGVLLVVIGAGLLGTGAVPLPVVPVVVVLGMALITVGVVSALLHVVGPNEALVISGRQRRLPDGSVVGYRVVLGGRVIKLPFIETVDRISLRTFPVPVKLRHTYCRGGESVDVEASALVKISTSPPVLHNAVERFLGRSLDEVGRVAAETLEGNLRGVVAALTLEELEHDVLKVAHVLMEESDADMSRLGLEVDAFNIEKVRRE